MRFVQADLRIHPRALLRAIHERGHAGDVALERQVLQVEHQLGVIVEPLRHADAGPVVLRQRRFGVLRLGLLNPALDLAQHIEVVRHRRPIRRPELRLQAVPSPAIAESRMLLFVRGRGHAGARPNRRRRTAARTPAADCSASAAASSATPTPAWCRRRSCSRCRSRRCTEFGRIASSSDGSGVSFLNCDGDDLIDRGPGAQVRPFGALDVRRRSATSRCCACDRRSRRQGSRRRDCAGR